MNGDLINKAHCRAFARRFAQENRKGWRPDRVSRQFLDDLNTHVRLKITGAVMKHPTVGKTIKYLI
jgi:hypothetical protein